MVVCVRCVFQFVTSYSEGNIRVNTPIGIMLSEKGAVGTTV